MIGIEQRTVCDGVNFRSVRDTKFKTVRMSVNFFMPIKKQTAASDALLTYILSRACKKYPDFTKLGEHLAELYGASINADVEKLGDTQLLSICASGIADRYALNGENVSTELTKLLCSIIFEPPFENGLFPLDSFEQEKRQIIELLDSEYNDKRIYARQRCEELMCSKEPYGINRYGSKEDIKNVKREDLTKAWHNLIEKSRIEIVVLGDCDTTNIYNEFYDAFNKVNRTSIVSCKTNNLLKADKVNDITEEMEVAQSKLVLGFRTQTAIPDEKVEDVILMSSMFGGTPNSKLFLNVREKLSLCYYCSSSYNLMKGIMLVQSGVETKNVEKAKDEIIFQLEEMKKGNFDDSEINAAKLSLCNSLYAISDSLSALEGWYLSQTFANQVKRPEESAAIINSINRQQIIEAANNVTLDTIYRLVGSGESAE